MNKIYLIVISLGAWFAFFPSIAIAVCYSDMMKSASDGTFIDNNDGTVLDSRTGLMWAKCAEGLEWYEGRCFGVGTRHTWGEAFSVVKARNDGAYLGFSDWRLPNKSELASLIEYSCVNPAIDTSVFVSTPNDMFWTSTPDYASPAMAWRVVFNYGNVTRGDRQDSYSLRLVRQ